MTLYLDKYCNLTNSDDLGSLLGGLQLFSEGETWDPAAWHDLINAINHTLNVKFEKKEVENKLTILKPFKAMTFFLEKYYELTTYEDLKTILVPLIIFEQNNDLNSPAWKQWFECVNIVLHEKSDC